MSISVGRLKFLDSFQFTTKCLDALSKTLADDEFRYLTEACVGDHFDLIRRKGVYPYDYMDSFDRFEETELAPQDAFFSRLSGVLMPIMHMQHVYGMHLIVKPLVITTMFTSSLIFY